MSVIVLLIAAGGVVAGGFLVAFAWALKTGQFDDTVSPAIRMLFEDAPRPSDGSPAEGAAHVHNRH